MTQCNLCGSENVTLVGNDRRRFFYLCGNCALVFVPKEYWLSVDDERARYDLHDNNLNNDGYVTFLSHIVDVVTRVAGNILPRAGIGQRPVDVCRPEKHQTANNIVKAGAKVLDFGCGKEAVVCRLLKDRGIDCYGYDPIYGRTLPEPVSKSGQYDIIILCEVIEHLRDIKSELALIGRLLREGGVVVLRTQIYESPASFPGWWYAQDLTHINFFNEKSLSVIAEMAGKSLERTGFTDIFLLTPTSETISAPVIQ